MGVYNCFVNHIQLNTDNFIIPYMKNWYIHKTVNRRVESGEIYIY